MEYENKYELLVEPKQYGRFYDSAIEFEMFCNAIYHAIVDDGDISFVQLTGECPAIIFKHRSEVTIDNAMSESQKRYIEQLNVFKSRYNQTLFHPELFFFDDAYEFIEAVANYDRASVERQQKAQAIIQNLSKTKSIDLSVQILYITLMIITRTSMFTGVTRSLDLPITEAQYRAWEEGELLQNAFPNLAPGLREFIKTGVTDEEWDSFIGSDPEE